MVTPLSCRAPQILRPNPRGSSWYSSRCMVRNSTSPQLHTTDFHLPLSSDGLLDRYLSCSVVISRSILRLLTQFCRTLHSLWSLAVLYEACDTPRYMQRFVYVTIDNDACICAIHVIIHEQPYVVRIGHKRKKRLYVFSVYTSCRHRAILHVGIYRNEILKGKSSKQSFWKEMDQTIIAWTQKCIFLCWASHVCSPSSFKLSWIKASKEGAEAAYLGVHFTGSEAWQDFGHVEQRSKRRLQNYWSLKMFLWHFSAWIHLLSIKLDSSKRRGKDYSLMWNAKEWFTCRSLPLQVQMKVQERHPWEWSPQKPHCSKNIKNHRCPFQLVKALGHQMVSCLSDKSTRFSQAWARS